MNDQCVCSKCGKFNRHALNDYVCKCKKPDFMFKNYADYVRYRNDKKDEDGIVVRIFIVVLGAIIYFQGLFVAFCVIAVIVMILKAIFF